MILEQTRTVLSDLADVTVERDCGGGIDGLGFVVPVRNEARVVDRFGDPVSGAEVTLVDLVDGGVTPVSGGDPLLGLRVG